jgi:hypothetical protein
MKKQYRAGKRDASLPEVSAVGQLEVKPRDGVITRAEPWLWRVDEGHNVLRPGPKFRSCDFGELLRFPPMTSKRVPRPFDKLRTRLRMASIRLDPPRGCLEGRLARLLGMTL